jgi:hypothetical protein
MILTKDVLDNITHGGYNDAWAHEVGLTLSDQLAIEQLKALKSIKNGVTFLVIIVIIGIGLSLLGACGALIR